MVVHVQHKVYISLFQLLEKKIVTFMKNELKEFRRFLSQRLDDDETVMYEDKEKRSSREAFLKITLHFLGRMNEEELAHRLQSSKTFCFIV